MAKKKNKAKSKPYVKVTKPKVVPKNVDEAEAKEEIKNSTENLEQTTVENNTSAELSTENEITDVESAEITATENADAEQSKADETKPEQANQKKKEKNKVVEVKAKDVGKNKKEKKPNKLAKSLKDTGNELKKVTWPKFKDVVKQTGVVLVVVIVFTLVLFGIDRLCSLLTGLLF